MRLKIALLFGGRSGEHEVSVRSAASVAAALADRYDVVPVHIDRTGRWLLQAGMVPGDGTPVFLAPEPAEGGRLRRRHDAAEVARPDVSFPVPHRTHRGDRTRQGLLALPPAPSAPAGV